VIATYAGPSLPRELAYAVGLIIASVGIGLFVADEFALAISSGTGGGMVFCGGLLAGALMLSRVPFWGRLWVFARRALLVVAALLSLVMALVVIDGHRSVSSFQAAPVHADVTF